MKKGINIWSFPGEASISDCIRLAKEAGFDGIELSLNQTGELGLQAGDKEVQNITAQLKDADLDIAGLATGLYWDYPMTSDDPAIREKAMDVCKKQLELAAAFGVDAILVIPGAVGVDFVPGSAVIDYEYAYERARIHSQAGSVRGKRRRFDRARECMEQIPVVPAGIADLH